MRVYYAHCLAIYNTPQEKRDVVLLERLGFEVDNPNNPRVQIDVAALKAADPKADIMEYFRTFVENCDLVVFRALPDGRIPAGVAKEIEYARGIGTPVLEFPSNMLARVMPLDQTREYLSEVGQR